MQSENTHDDELLSILSETGDIVNFFEVIFDFLRRRTDFFKIKREGSDSLGLEAGAAEQIIRSVFRSHVMKASIENVGIMLESLTNPLPPDYVQEEIVETSESTENLEVSEEVSSNLVETSNESKEEETIEASKSTEISDNQESVEEDSLSTLVETSEESKEIDNSGNATKNSDVSDPKIPVMDPDCYNGGCCDEYSWSQTLKDVDIFVKVSPETISGKQVRVEMQQTYLKVEIIEDDNWKVVKEGNLTWKINVEESTWTLVPCENILICLQKMKERWWDSVFADDPKIDLKAIDPSIPYEDLDRDSQVKIDELLYNEHLKRLGKPSIQETKLHGILKDAWDAEGSPFKGQSFDPSLVNIQNAEDFNK